MKRVTLQGMHQILAIDALNALDDTGAAHKLGKKIRRQGGLNKPNNRDLSLIAKALFLYELESNPLAADGIDAVAQRLHIVRRLEAHYREFIRKHSTRAAAGGGRGG